jgi:hypothetical protein
MGKVVPPAVPFVISETAIFREGAAEKERRHLV